MASGTLLGGGDGGGDGGSRDIHRWASGGKVYARKSFNKSSKSSSANPAPVVASGKPFKPMPPLPATSDDASSSLNRPAFPSQKQQTDENLPTLMPHKNNNGYGRSVIISVGSRSRKELRELRRKLMGELEQVRAFLKRFDAHEMQLGVGLASVTPPGYAVSQFSATDTNTPVAGKRMSEAPTPTGGLGLQRRQLSVNVAANEINPMEGLEKEKRTPKANQYYRNSEFLLAKDKFPPESHGSKKSKTNGSNASAAEKRMYTQAFKSCSALLSKLMKHKHGWVFNQPVDVKGLGLHDYYIIIKHPMDLGTVRSRLAKNWYKSSREFAEDVRLTFRNAITYNPRGQDVHVMAEELLQIFEECWPAIEAEFTYISHPPVTKKPQPLDLRTLERSDSTVHPVAVEPKTKTASHPTPFARTPAPKKPKAKDLNKRNMTFEEKQKLSNNLQNLPPEKLESIVQLIKKRNLSLSQHDDEIEVDIDSVDVETLWELDRFVMNYKKSLSKNKRRAELAMLSRQQAERNAQEMPQERIEERPVSEVPDKIMTASSAPFVGEKKTDNANGSSSSSSSSSDSGSSSSDSDSDSSSGYGSDAERSPRT